MTESLAWTCRCGAWCWNHYAHCAACGTEKPAPQEAQPTDEARPEPPWRMGDQYDWMDDQYKRMLRDAQAEIDRKQLASAIRRAFPRGCAWR
jgi:hypothetical protein